MMKLKFLKLQSDKVLVLLIIVLVISVLGYRLLNKKTVEGFSGFSIIGNPLVYGDGSNVTVTNFGIETDSRNLVLGNLSKIVQTLSLKVVIKQPVICIFTKVFSSKGISVKITFAQCLDVSTLCNSNGLFLRNFFFTNL